MLLVKQLLKHEHSTSHRAVIFANEMGCPCVQVEAKQQEIDALQKRVSQLQQEAQTAAAGADRTSKQQLVNKDAEIAALQGQNRQLNERLAAVSTQLSQVQSEVQRLQAALAQERLRAQQLQTTQAQQQSRAQQLQSDLEQEKKASSNSSVGSGVCCE